MCQLFHHLIDFPSLIIHTYIFKGEIQLFAYENITGTMEVSYSKFLASRRNYLAVTQIKAITLSNLSKLQATGNYCLKYFDSLRYKYS